MIQHLLRLVANVIFPAVAGYVVTLHLVVPLSMVWLPGFGPEALMVVPMTGLVTTLLCVLPARVRVALRQRAD